MAKIVKIALALILFSISSVKASNGDENNKELEIELKKELNTKRPRVPMLQNVYCYYSDSILTVEFRNQEGQAVIEVVTPDNNVICESFTTSCIYIVNIGAQPGVYQIEISTEANTYIGTFEI